MTDTLRIVDIDVSKGTSIERDMTEEEQAQFIATANKISEDAKKQEAADAAKAAAKESANAKLAKLGLTADEIAAIIG